MKKIFILLILFIFLSVTFTACTLGSSQSKGTFTPSAVNTGTQNTNQSVYGEGYNMNMVVGVDEFGRTVSPIENERQNREVGLFYWIWHGQHNATGIYDNTKILAMEDGFNKLFKTAGPESPANQMHWWGEPIYGYYNSMDDYIIRKHMELLTAAGIDFIVFDTTNGPTYNNVYRKVMKVISQMRSEGWDAPLVCFYTHTNSMDTVRKLYNELYSKDYCSDTWYRINGKPMIIAYTEVGAEKEHNFGQPEALPQPYSQEIKDFFFFKQPCWPWDTPTNNNFPWCEWQYPQPAHGNMMNVTVAAHPGNPFSASLTGTNNRINWGRGWDPATKTNHTDQVNVGSFYQKSWDVALKADPEMVFVGGWNEWQMFKNYSEEYNEYIFVDNVNIEFSRDIEPMKGGYNDAFYIQTVMNIRKYKGQPYTDIQTEGAKTIDINGEVSQWNNVKAVYRNIGQTNYDRNSNGASTAVRYKQDEARNNLQEIKVANDVENIYFYIRSSEPITQPEGNNWMNLFIGTGTPANKGWVCYDYAVNRSITDNETAIEKLNADYTGTIVGKAKLAQKDNILQIAVPRAALGLSANDNTFYFKVADNVEKPDDIMDYYVTGKCMPVGRLSYQYFG